MSKPAPQVLTVSLSGGVTMSCTTAAGPVPAKDGSSPQVRLAEYWTKSSGRSTSDSSKELRPSRELRRELVLFVNGAQASELCAETNRYQAMERRPRLWKNEPGICGCGPFGVPAPGSGGGLSVGWEWIERRRCECGYTVANTAAASTS